MSDADTGGPAFPLHVPTLAYGDASETFEGMTLRDYFAAKALQAMVTKSDGQSKTGGKKGVQLIAAYAYEFADAMLKARQS